jgi:hypothetical protein
LVPTVTLLAAMSSAVLLLAGCGPTTSTPASGASGPTTSATSTTSPGTTAGTTTSATGTWSAAPAPSATPGGSSVPASQLNTTGMAAGPPNGVWTQNGGRTIALAAEQAGCDTPSATVTSQTASQVVIRLAMTSKAKPGVMCPMIVRQVVVTVQLSAPLGDRLLVLQGSLTR